MGIDTAKIIELLWENWAINNRADFLNKMKQAIPDMVLLSPNDPSYKTPIDLKIFITIFKTYILGIDKRVKDIDALTEKVNNRGINKLGGKIFNLTYNFEEFKDKIKNLFLKASTDCKVFSNEYSLNEAIFITAKNEDPMKVISLYVKDGVAYLYERLLNIENYITQKELHGGDFIIKYDFTEIKEEFKKLEQIIARDLRATTDNAQKHGKTQEEILAHLMGEDAKRLNKEK